MTLGTGALKIMSVKHKIITKRSTEAEIVGVSDGMDGNLGLVYFMDINKDIMFNISSCTQDNILPR